MASRGRAQLDALCPRLEQARAMQGGWKDAKRSRHRGGTSTRAQVPEGDRCWGAQAMGVGGQAVGFRLLDSPTACPPAAVGGGQI